VPLYTFITSTLRWSKQMTRNYYGTRVYSEMEETE
jgi:hypothetical protein